ncbi:MAG: peptidoglycan binding domain-containing protein [Eubacterium sp.]|nr:peptidoglycan binding domain-containing protein [Eubacterium sp.]
MGLTKEKLRRRRRQELKRRIMLVAIPVIFLLIIIYIVGAVYFSKHFYGRDTVFGIKIARQTTEELKEQVVEKVRGYQIALQTRTGEEIITAQETDLQFADNGMIEELLDKQRALFWFTGIFGKSEDIPIEMAYDEALMDERITNLACLNEENMEEPVDAHLEYRDGGFQIVKEVMGTLLDVETTSAKIKESILNGEEVLDLEVVQLYINPTIYEDSKELARMQDDVNRLIDVTIVYDFEDRSETVDSEKISEWIVFGDNFTYELDAGLVEDYIRTLGKTYDTFGLPHKFTTSNGDTITLDQGDYGWVIHKEKTTQELIDLINAGKAVTTEPIYLYEAKSRSTNDIGDTYVEVSINQQWMWCYVDGVCIVDTPVVTGTAGVADRETPRDGVWAIDAKMTDYYLVGEDYNSHVDYWLPFNGNVGIHDADWRTPEEFGGATYKTNGSHGCVNTPYNAAKKIYENVTIGTPVIVY